MALYTIDPLTDNRWDGFVSRHPQASIFHTRSWLSALQQTYGYKPLVLTSSPSGCPLEDGLAFCEVSSWVTGRRVVSLPFSDHCDWLTGSSVEPSDIVSDLRALLDDRRCQYAELRPLYVEQPEAVSAPDLRCGASFYFHDLPLDAPIVVLFRQLHRDCIQRKIRRAEREQIVYEKGRDEGLLNKFYALLIKTRRRQCLPPQPLQWFRNLIDSMGDNLTIRVASKGADPVAAIITLSFKTTVTYKYGCSDERFSHLGGTPFLFWQTIQEAREEGASHLDLGRCDLDNEGLAIFKERLGAQRRPLTYWRIVRKGDPVPSRPPWINKLAKRVMPCVPAWVMTASGRVLYRHVG